MKKMNLLKLSTLVVLGLTITFTSCKKRKLNKATTTSEDNSKAEALFDDIFNTTDKYDDTEKDISESNKMGALSDTTYTHAKYACLTITKEFIDEANYERKITFDFGTTGCETADGKVRKGKIIAHRVGKWLGTGSTHTITAEGYYVDGYKVDGTRTITNEGNLKFKIVVSGTILTPDGETITWSSTRTRTWVEGSGTTIFGTINADGTIDSLFWNFPNGIYDDVWEITGGATGINREGRAFTADITTPIRVQWCEPYIEVTKGVVEVTPEDLKTRVVDFGDGSCDNTATVTIGNKTYNYEFRK